MHKITGPLFFEETNSNRYVQLILAPLFRELKGRRENIGHSTFFARIEGQ
jgi:hypothetical protein